MNHRNHTVKPRFRVVYQAWSDDQRPALRLTPIGKIVAENTVTDLVTARVDCGCAGKKGK